MSKLTRSLKVILSQLIHGTRPNIRLGSGSYLSISSQIFGTDLTVGDQTGIEGLYCIGSQSVSIGKYCAIAGDLTIITSNHILTKANIQAKLQVENFHDSMDDGSKGPVVIGNNVWIGRSVIILPGVQVGHGAVIGAGSVVTKSVDPFTIVAGNPARVIRQRFTTRTIKRLLKDAWWDWDEIKISKNRAYFIKVLK